MWSLKEHVCMQGYRKRACFLSWIACNHTYHRYHHDVPSFLSRHAAYGNVTWNVPAALCLPAQIQMQIPRYRKRRSINSHRPKRQSNPIMIFCSLPSDLHRLAGLSGSRYFSTSSSHQQQILTVGSFCNVLTPCWKSPLLSRPCKASKNSALQHFLLTVLIAISALRTLARVPLLLHSRA